MFIPDAQTQYIVASHLNRFQLKVAIMNGDKLSQWLEDEGAEYSPPGQHRRGNHLLYAGQRTHRNRTPLQLEGHRSVELPQVRRRRAA